MKRGPNHLNFVGTNMYYCGSGNETFKDVENDDKPICNINDAFTVMLRLKLPHCTNLMRGGRVP